MAGQGDGAVRDIANMGAYKAWVMQQEMGVIGGEYHYFPGEEPDAAADMGRAKAWMFQQETGGIQGDQYIDGPAPARGAHQAVPNDRLMLAPPER